MTSRIRAVIFASIWVVTAALAVFGMTMNMINNGDEPQSFVALGYATVGALILARRPHRIGLLFLGFGVLAAFTGAFMEVCRADIALLGGERVCADTRIGEVLWPTNYLFFGSVLLLFPTGNLPSRRWRWVACLFFGSWLLLIAIAATGARVSLAGVGADSVLVPAALVGLASVAAAPLFRLRRAGAVERQQLRLLGYVMALSFVELVVGVLLVDLVGLDALAQPMGFLVLMNVVIGIPAAVGVAILKYRLFEIDVLINRTLVYGLLTALLAGAYLGIVFALQLVLGDVTKDSQIAVAASTLAVAALFTPLRGRVQAFIDRRFYRRKYDAQQTLEAFAGRLRREIELASVEADVIGVVAQTLQPAHASLWLKGPISAS